MRFWLARAAAILWLLPAFLWAGEPPVSYSKFCVTCGIRDADTIASFSGQFVVHGPTLPIPRMLLAATRKTNYLELNPQLVAVTAERVREGLLTELQLLNAFQQKVHLLILPLAPPEQPVTIVSRIYLDGVVFQVGIPARIEPNRLIKALVQVLLSDLASRAAPRDAEIPTWLVEGLTEHLFARVQPTIVANKILSTYEVAGYDRLKPARQVLATNTCLTFHELSFPKREMDETEASIYQSSSHLFLAELLRLPHGRPLLARFVATLPQSLNWQTSFYRVYGQHFQTALDVEKWWALSWFDFKVRQEEQTWPMHLSLQKLNSVLLTTVEMRTSANSLPQRREVPLQQLIEYHTFESQSVALSDKMRQMFFLQFNMPPETRAILAEYRNLLEEYLERRSRSGEAPGEALPRRVESLVRSTKEKLDDLDKKRESLRLLAGTP